MNIIIKNKVVKKQSGVALIMSLIMLLLITIIGASSLKLSMNDTQIAGNSIYSSLVFQGAESALNRSVSNSDIFDIQIPASERSTLHEINDLDDEDVVGGGKLNSKSSIKFERILNAPQLNTSANSSNFKYQVFKVTAESKLQGTSAKDTHTEGRAIQIPEN